MGSDAVAIRTTEDLGAVEFVIAGRVLVVSVEFLEGLDPDTTQGELAADVVNLTVPSGGGGWTAGEGLELAGAVLEEAARRRAGWTAWHEANCPTRGFGCDGWKPWVGPSVHGVATDGGACWDRYLVARGTGR